MTELMRGIRPEEECMEVRWDEDRRWWIGRVNLFSAVRGGQSPPASVKITDLTLRDGEEVPGVVLPLDAKIRIASWVVEAGFREMEVGYGGVIDEHQEIIRALHEANTPIALASHTRIYGQEDEWKREIDKNLELGVDILTFVGFASEVGTATTPWLKKEGVPDRISSCVSYAKDQGATVTFGLADLVRTQLDYIVACYRAAVDAGSDRLYVYDGLGAATPEAIGYLTHLLKDLAGRDIEIGVHIHDTFGMSTAAAVRAVIEGATVVDAVPLGLGDGAGITASEEVAVALELFYGVSTGIDLSRLKWLCENVAREFGIEVPPGKSLVGANQYRHSIDSHVAAILRGAWHSWEVLRPDVIGQDRELQFGYAKLRRGRSGALYAKAQQMGHDPSMEEMDEILERVRTVTERKPYASESDVESIVREVVGR
jgi:isopropylmalate/homocitrate/citramalate synthase